MPVQRLTLLITLAGAMLLAAGQASGQQFPTKPIRIYAAGPGGGTDDTARLIALGLSRNIGQGVIVENRQGVIGAEATMKAAPDGHTLFLGSNSLWTGTLLRKENSFDPVRDFAPITMTASFPTVMFINAAIPANSLKEFIALAKAKPQEFNYAMTSIGGSSHLASELFKTMAGTNLTQVAYKTAGNANADLLAGRVHVFFSAPGPLMPHVKTGKLKALAVTSAKPSALLPDIPTVAATVPGYEMGSVYCLFAPAKTPAAIITVLNREVVRVLKAPEATQQLLNFGFEVVASTAEELANMRRDDIARVTKLIKDAGISVE